MGMHKFPDIIPKSKSEQSTQQIQGFSSFFLSFLPSFSFLLFISDVRIDKMTGGQSDCARILKTCDNQERCFLDLVD